MLEQHDKDQTHVSRRDRFVELILSGVPIFPLIALGPGLSLVDGYARYRALRLLGVDRAEGRIPVNVATRRVCVDLVWSAD